MNQRSAASDAHLAACGERLAPCPFEAKLAEAWPPEAWQDVSVLLAVSGGADSMAMLHGMARLKAVGSGCLTAAHLHHGLRGQEADDDARLVEKTCQELAIPLETGHAEVAARADAEGDGLEAAARHARYEFLEATAERLGARYVVTAHTADDQAETILHRIVRGTGLAGLAGIPRARRLNQVTTLIRPLLGFRREEVVEYLASLGKPYCEDSSNHNTRLTRNHIRHELLPMLRANYNAKVTEALVRLGSLAAEAQRVIDSLVGELTERGIASGENESMVADCVALGGEPRYLVREVLKAVWRTRDWPQQAMGFAEWDEMAEMLLGDPKPAKRIFPGGVVADRQGERLVLTRGV